MIDCNDANFSITFCEKSIILTNFSQRTVKESLQYLHSLVGLPIPTHLEINSEDTHFSSCINLGASIYLYADGDIVIIFDSPTPMDKVIPTLKSLLLEFSFGN